MSDYKFDPVTGKPITDQSNTGFKFDPMTGKPINPTINEGPKFDPMTGKPINPTINDGPKFDPMTGKPINPAASDGPKFDPMTGKPIEQPKKEGPQFDPFTGKPIEQPKADAPSFDPFTGKPVSQNVSQNSYGASNVATPYVYDPAGLEKAQNAKNKKVAVIVLVLVIIAFIGLGIFGVVKAFEMIQNKAANEHVEVTIDDDITSENIPDDTDESLVEQPIEPKEDTLGEPAPEPAPEEPATDEQPIQETPAEEQITEEAPSTEPESAPSGEPDAMAGSSGLTDVDTDDLFSFAFGDKNYKVPMKVSTLLADGWNFKTPSEATDMLGSGDTAYIYFTTPYADNRGFSLDIKNFSIDAQKTQDCYITGVTLYDFDSEKAGIDFTVHSGNIKVGTSTQEDVKNALGEPTDIRDSLDEPVYYYYKDNNKDNYEARVTITFKENVISYISLKNEIKPDDLEQEQVSDEVPDYLSNYVAPSGLGTDPLKANFQLDGIVYNLPVPLQVFVDNGWTYDVEDEYTVGAGEGYVITIHKDDNRVTATVFNCNEKATYLKNTIVTSVSAYNRNSLKNDMEFADGLKPGMSETDLLKWLNKHNIKNYGYSSSTEIYKIPLDPNDEADYAANRYFIFIDEGEIESIDLTNYGWLRQE